jgi:hypothetical protein
VLYDVKWDATLLADRDRVDVCLCGSSACRVEVQDGGLCRLLAGDSALPTGGMGSTTGTSTVTQRKTGESGVRAAGRSSSGGGRGKEVLCTTGCRLAGRPCVGANRIVGHRMRNGWEGELRLWPKRRSVVVSGRHGEEAEQNAEGRGSRADCAVLTRAGPMQGVRAVECDRGTLSAARLRDWRESAVGGGTRW